MVLLNFFVSAGDDYSEINGIILYPIGTNDDTLCINITIIDNLSFEKSENFTVTVDMVTVYNIIANGSQTTVQILDDEGIISSLQEAIFQLAICSVACELGHE